MTTLTATQKRHLETQLEKLGFTSYQARLLLALIIIGSATSSQLANLSGVNRTSIYKAIDVLIGQGLAEPTPSLGPTVWTCPGWQTVLDTLDTTAEEQLHHHHTRTQQLRQTLAELLPHRPPATSPSPP